MILYNNGKTIDTNETTRREPNKEEIKEILENLDDYELLRIWNEFDQYSTIYTSEEFDEICDSMTATDLANKIFYGDFNPNHNFWTFNGYENLKSSDYIDELISIDDLADYIHDNEDTFDNDDLQEYFDNLEEDEDEEGGEE